MSSKVLKFPDRVAVRASEPQAVASAPAPSAPKRKVPAQPPELARPPRTLTDAEATLQRRMMRAYFDGNRPARKHAASSIRRDRLHVEDLLAFVGQPIWEITPGDFEVWSAHAALSRKLATGSQRVLQGAVATFFDYLVDNPAWQNEAHRQFDGCIRRIATSANRTIHVTDTPTRERKFYCAEELNLIFEAIDVLIRVCAEEFPKYLRCLQRDKVMFYTWYTFALRLQEGQQLNISSFAPNPDVAELGSYGFAGVWGKGAHGSGPKFRSIPAIDPDIAPLLTWYFAEVRPLFPIRTEDARQAVWLSVHGKRLSRSSIAHRFKQLISGIGLEERLFSPHVLRHVATSHSAAADVPLNFTKDRLGHRNASTTQQYMHLPDRFNRDVARNIVRAMIEGRTS